MDSNTIRNDAGKTNDKPRTPKTMLKLVSWNAGNKSIRESLLAELKNLSIHTLLTVNETKNLQDLSDLGLIGFRHSSKIMRGLCIYVSTFLQHYTTVTEGKYALHGVLNLPTVDGHDPVTIGYIGTYRSPELTTDVELVDYFNDLSSTVETLQETCDLIYLMGDLNMFSHRFDIDDHTRVVEVPSYRPEVKAFRMFESSLPSSSWKYLFDDTPTHIPYQKNAKTCAKLDYMVRIHSGDRFPAGRSKHWIGKSDHKALVHVLNIPYLKPVEVSFFKTTHAYNTDFELIDAVILQELEDEGISEENCTFDFEYLEMAKSVMLDVCSDHKCVMKPRSTDKNDAAVLLLQYRANNARIKGETILHKQLVQEIREQMTIAAEAEMSRASGDKSSTIFHRWARGVAKPCKSQQGKYAMVNKSVKEITDVINENYTAPDDFEADWFEEPDSGLGDEDEFWDTLDQNDFSFSKALTKVHKVPRDFKNCPLSSVLISERLLRITVKTRCYPDCLKLSKCSILPDRSIFQIVVPHAKLVEAAIACFLTKYVDEIENMAYRPKMSTTALLVNEFDAFARYKSLYGFNGDLKKAFDRLSRKLIIKAIPNKLVKNIVFSWMNRTGIPYLIWWRGEWWLIDRDGWTRGVEPGSVLGPVVFILGLNDKEHYNRSILKSIFADDNFPLYTLLSDLRADAALFTNWVYANHMELHRSGEKKWSFSVFGADASSLKDLGAVDIECDIGDLPCDRVFSVKQLGLKFDIDKNGIPIVDMSDKIARLKETCSALRRLSPTCLTSTTLHLIKVYVVTVVSYAICVWYPNLFYHRNKVDNITRKDKIRLAKGDDPEREVSRTVKYFCTNSLEELRYWYISTLNYACYDNKTLMGWSNSSKSLARDTSVAGKMCLLTGMPSFEELYIASCITHYKHFKNMYKKGIGSLRADSAKPGLGVLKFNERSKKLIYTGRELNGRVSPLRLLIANVNAIGDLNCKDDMECDVSPSIEDSILVQLEKLCQAREEPRAHVRQMQRILSLAFFGKIDLSNDMTSTSVISQGDIDFASDHAGEIRTHLKRFRKEQRIGSIRADDCYPTEARFRKND